MLARPSRNQGAVHLQLRWGGKWWPDEGINRKEWKARDLEMPTEVATADVLFFSVRCWELHGEESHAPEHATFINKHLSPTTPVVTLSNAKQLSAIADGELWVSTLRTPC